MLHIRYAMLELSDHHFRARSHGRAIVCARAACMPRAAAQVHDLAGAARTNSAIHRTDHANHVVIRRINGAILRGEPDEKLVHDGSSEESAKQRYEQALDQPDAEVVRHHVADAAEPCEKRHDGRKVEGRDVRDVDSIAS